MPGHSSDPIQDLAKFTVKKNTTKDRIQTKLAEAVSNVQRNKPGFIPIVISIKTLADPAGKEIRLTLSYEKDKDSEGFQFHSKCDDKAWNFSNPSLDQFFEKLEKK